MAAIKLLCLVLLPHFHSAQPSELISKLNKVADFALERSGEINFDGLLGFVIAEAQLAQCLQSGDVIVDLELLLLKFQEVKRRVLPNLPKTPQKMVVLQKYLLCPQNWISGENFTTSLHDLGVYTNWSSEDITKDKSAEYRGVPSDHCLMEILDNNCFQSVFCKEMMLAPRIDKGYLLSHRLLYLQVVRLKRCQYDQRRFRQLTSEFCALMLREIRTNRRLGFPARDIALEQMVLCGIEGYAEFLGGDLRRQVVEWQNQFGCYKSRDEEYGKRSSNVIDFGCSDHTTGLGAAALALHLRFSLN